MAPDSRYWRHHLGEATVSLRRGLLKAALPFCFVISLTSSTLEARTEPKMDSWSKHSSTFLAYERATYGNSHVAPSLSPPVFLNHPPVGERSNGIQIHIPNQPSIQSYIRFYKGQGRYTFLDSLERSWPYVPVMADILESYGVPAEMMAIVFVESRFKRHASFRGAGGYWQLLAGTARKMGLRVDRWVDERCDPVKSTHAAAKYLRSFYDRYRCWSLALAAYNAGDGPISSALKRGQEDDYWELSRRKALPRRTQTYVSKVLAAIQVMRDLEAHGFNRPQYSSVYDFETTSVRIPLTLEEVARWLNVPLDQLRELNPSLRLDRVPPDCGYNLRLPSGARDRFDLAYEGHLRR